MIGRAKLPGVTEWRIDFLGGAMSCHAGSGRVHSPGVITLKLISLLLQIQPELKVPILIAVAAGLG